jgi:hypothetical protein
MLKSIIQILLFVAIIFLNIPIPLLSEIFNIEHGAIYNDGLFLHIMLKGTPNLVLAFILRFIRTLKLDIVNIILLFGVLIAGNFAFLLGLFCFLFYYLFMIFLPQRKQWCLYIVLFFFCFVLVSIIAMPYITEQIYRKSFHSNPTRIDQANVLLTTGNVFTGNGFGHNINTVTQFRDYTYAVYFELQTLYIINQIGIVGYLLFMICTIYIFYKQNSRMLPLYLLYLLYSFWNPYCFDSTHMITAILLIGNRMVGSCYYNKLTGNIS